MQKRIMIFAGHYGSGKTTIAVNYALWLKKTHPNVAICDLDIVNPYFRTLDALEWIETAGIRLISSAYANTNVDLPSVPPQAQSIFDDTNVNAVVDLGGDDRGALALGRYAGFINSENNYEMLLVINKYRPLTRDIQSLAGIRNEIEKAAGVAFTGVVNNSNLGRETTCRLVLESVPFALEVAQALHLPLKMTAIRQDFLKQAESAADSGCGDFFPVDMFPKEDWQL